MSFAIPYLVYLFLLGILAVSCNRLSTSLRERMWMPCLLISMVFFGLRGYVGDDWTGYHVVFEFVQPNDFHLNIFGRHSFRYEPGFAILAYVCRWLVGSQGFLFFQAVTTLLQLLLLFRFLRRYSDNIPLSLIVFIAMGGLVMLINTMRNTLAILIFLNGLHLIKQRKVWPYLCYCVAAMAFHMSSVLFIPLYWVLHREISKWLYLVVFMLSNAIVLLKIPVLSLGVGTVADIVGGKLAYMVKAYLEDEHMMAMSFSLSIGYLERLGTGLIIFFYWNKLKAIRPENVLFMNAMLLFFVFYFWFSEVREVGRRLSELFIFGYWILWPDLFKCFQQKLMRIGFAAFLCVYCSLKVVGTIGYPNTRYENVLTGFTHYRQRLHQHTDEALEVTKAQQGGE